MSLSLGGDGVFSHGRRQMGRHRAVLWGREMCEREAGADDHGPCSEEPAKENSRSPER